jgi:hypothetical protein
MPPHERFAGCAEPFVFPAEAPVLAKPGERALTTQRLGSTPRNTFGIGGNRCQLNQMVSM